MKTDFQTKWSEIVAKSSTDIVFRKKLLDNPNEVIRFYGIKLPKDVKVNVIEQESENDIYMILPPIKRAEALNDDLLKEVSAANLELDRQLLR